MASISSGFAAQQRMHQTARQRTASAPLVMRQSLCRLETSRLDRDRKKDRAGHGGVVRLRAGHRTTTSITANTGCLARAGAKMPLLTQALRCSRWMFDRRTQCRYA